MPRNYTRKDDPRRAQAIAQAIPALRQGVAPSTIAPRIGVHPRTLTRWLQHHPDAYENRLWFITNCLVAPDPANTPFWRQVRLTTLSLYRIEHGLPKQTRRKRKPANNRARLCPTTPAPRIQTSNAGFMGRDSRWALQSRPPRHNSTLFLYQPMPP